MSPLPLLPLCLRLLLFFSFASSVAASDTPQPRYGQSLFGQLKLNDNTVAFESDNQTFEGTLPDRIPYLGAMVQVPSEDGIIGYGWEGGGFFSWQNDSIDYFASVGDDGGTLKVSVDNQYWSFETFMGLYASTRPFSPLRLFVSGGPLFMFASAHIKNAETTNETEPVNRNGSVIIIDTSERDYDFTVGGYARVGMDFQIHPDFWLGVSARYMHAEVDLPDSVGTFNINGTLFFFSLTKQM